MNKIHHKHWNAFRWLFIYYGSDYYVYFSETNMHIKSAYVNVFVMWLLCVRTNIQVQLKVSMNVSCFPQYVGWQWTVKSQIVHWLIVILCASLGPGIVKWLRHYITSWQVPGSISRTICLGSTHPLKVSMRDFSWGKGGRCVRLRTLHPSSAERQENPGP